MSSAYSDDLRKKVIDAYEEKSGTQQEIADSFSLHISTFKRIISFYRKTGKLSKERNITGRPNKVSEVGEQAIKEYILKNPDVILLDIQEFYHHNYGDQVSLSTIHRITKKLGFRRKKKSFFAEEQMQDDVKKKN